MAYVGVSNSSIAGRTVKSVPASCSYFVNTNEAEPEFVVEETTILDNEDFEVSQVQPKHLNTSPDTTVLGMESFEDFEDDSDTLTETDNEPDIEEIVEEEVEKTPDFIIQNLNTNEKFTVNKDKYVVGKSKYSDCQVKKNNTVSRSHVILTVEDNMLWVEDNDSKNGTSVGGIFLKPHVKKMLNDGDILRLSDEEFKVIYEV